MSGHLGREKTYRMRVKPSGHASAPLQSLPVPADCWKSMRLDFVFGLPADDRGNTGILVFVCRLSKMVHFAPIACFATADHPQTDGQTKRVNRVLEDTLRSICAEAPRSWSDQLPMVVFALHNAVHASTGITPSYLNGLRHPQVVITLWGGTVVPIVSGGEAPKTFSSQVSDIELKSLKIHFSSIIDDRLTLIGPVREAMASAPDRQKEYSDKRSRGNLSDFKTESNKLKHRLIGLHGAADLPKSMATHSTFCVGRLKRYHDPLGPPSRAEDDQGENSPL
ncbi:Pol protein [Phytophthora palmivora]|uniref:Pol protein n=1 Tax=Phytophthora palmivora TaxID=4796 RepID=A0A2P4XGH9_9STRA|nr:Pol protein [Phytophthora palmivora]